jgi:hypothetical protein
MKVDKRVLTIALMLAAGAALDASANRLVVGNKFPDMEVWITTYRDGDQIHSFCIGKGGTTTQFSPHYLQGFKIRAEVMTGPSCKGTKICDTDMKADAQGAPGFLNPDSGIYIHRNATDPKRCYISWKAEPDVHKMTVRNTYKDRYVWITAYENPGGWGPKIISAHCVNPASERSFLHDHYTPGYRVRAEVMTGAACKGTKVCDTNATAPFDVWNKIAYPIVVRQNATDPNNCHIGPN